MNSLFLIFDLRHSSSEDLVQYHFQIIVKIIIAIKSFKMCYMTMILIVISTVYCQNHWSERSTL